MRVAAPHVSPVSTSAGSGFPGSYLETTGALAVEGESMREGDREGGAMAAVRTEWGLTEAQLAVGYAQCAGGVA